MGKNNPEHSLASLARSAATGDARALEALLTELYPRVRLFFRHWLFRRSCRDDISKDLAQETLIRIAERLSTCRAEADGQVVEWSLVVARRVGVDHLRALRTEWRSGRVRIPADGVSADETGGVSEAAQLVGGLVARLFVRETERVQDLLWYRVVEQRKWAEVAALVGTTPSGAKRIFQRAQRRLRTAVLRAVDELPDDDRAIARAWMRAVQVRERSGAQ